MPVPIALAGDYNPARIAHQAIPLAPKQAARASWLYWGSTL